MELPLHPKIVHLPMALAVLVPLFSLSLLVAWWRQWLPKRAWLVVVAMQAILVVSSYVALETGEEEEHRVEEVTGHDAVHEHEEAAELFFKASIGILALFLGGAFVRKETVARGIAASAVVASLGGLYVGVQTGEAGGALVYEHNAGAAYGPDAPPPGEHRGDGHDEDDD